MPRTLLLVGPREFKGENQGLYIQHVASMRWLLDGSSGWTAQAISLDHPELVRATDEADAVVLHNQAHAAAEGMIRRRRALGRPTVFEFGDNFLALGGWLPERHPLRSPLARSHLLHNAWLCDAVQVYAEPLARLFASVNARVQIFDPYVPIAGPRVRAEGPLVVGWAGTNSHALDLARIAPPVVSFCQSHPDVVFAFMGDRALFEQHFAQIRPEQARVRPFGAYQNYLDFVRGWDVGLAPLGRDGFSNGRTSAKFATYAACGIVPLLEAHPVHAPYAEVSLQFDSAQALYEHLVRLHAQPQRGEEIARRAHEWARLERNPDVLRRQRTGLYESLLGRPGGPGSRFVEGAEPTALAEIRRKLKTQGPTSGLLSALLEQRPFDYLALRALIAQKEAGSPHDPTLGPLYERLCLLAPDTVPLHRRPAHLREFLPE